MKIKNIFKKENKIVAKAKVEKIDKKQLEKVIGGGINPVDPSMPVRISTNFTVEK